MGAYLVELGGCDVVAFAGGIGENGATIREAVCAGLEGLGIKLDPAKNAAAKGEESYQRRRQLDAGVDHPDERRDRRGAAI
ncbi:MAG: hypothetical protein QM775_26760 [Pirellulales bacterium]